MLIKLSKENRDRLAFFAELASRDFVTLRKGSVIAMICYFRRAFKKQLIEKIKQLEFVKGRFVIILMRLVLQFKSPISTLFSKSYRKFIYSLFSIFYSRRFHFSLNY